MIKITHDVEWDWMIVAINITRPVDSEGIVQDQNFQAHHYMASAP